MKKTQISRQSSRQAGFVKLLVIVVVAILAVGGGAYYYSQNFPIKDPQTAAQTTGWKTYTNTKYGFEFKLPDSFTGSILTDDPYVFSFRTKNEPFLTLLGTIDKKYGAYSNVSEIFVGGVKSYKGGISTDCYKGCESNMSVFVPINNEKSLHFSFSKSYGGTIEEVAISPTEESLFTEILSTFKFVN